jgi:ActR/RegA family two-component response regulator
MKKVVLLLDDEENIKRDLGGYLLSNGYGVHKASSIEEAKKIILSESIDYAIVDLKIDYETEFGGAQIVNFVKRIHPKAKAIILSAYSLDEEIKSKFDVEIDGYVAKGGQDNYILAVFGKLKELESQPENKTCFVIMPFSTSKSCKEEEWTEIFNEQIKPAVEEAGFGYKCYRSQALFGNIIENILDDLNRADMVIADLTDRNPNVFYELGVRQVLRGATVLIAQHIDDIPFDLRPYAIQVYDWRLSGGKRQFKERIKEIIATFECHPEKASSPIRKYLNL